MNDVTIKNRIEAAMGGQKAPEKLVQQTVLRVQGIAAGRNAEQRLEAARRAASTWNMGKVISPANGE